jgi:hypothetical protein
MELAFLNSQVIRSDSDNDQNEAKQLGFLWKHLEKACPDWKARIEEEDLYWMALQVDLTQSLRYNHSLFL